MLTHILFKIQSMLISATGRASQMLTYILFNTQGELLSARSRKDQPDAGSHPVQNPEYTVVRNKQKGPARC